MGEGIGEDGKVSERRGRHGGGLVVIVVVLVEQIGRARKRGGLCKSGGAALRGGEAREIP